MDNPIQPQGDEQKSYSDVIAALYKLWSDMNLERVRLEERIHELEAERIVLLTKLPAAEAQIYQDTP